MKVSLNLMFVLLVALCGVNTLSAQTVTSPCPTAAFSTLETGGPPGNQPYITAGGGCNVIITFAANGSISTTIVNPNPYDGVEDTLVGIVNNTGAPITSIDLSSSAAIFGFDGDGICASEWAVSPCNNGGVRLRRWRWPQLQ